MSDKLLNAITTAVEGALFDYFGDNSHCDISEDVVQAALTAHAEFNEGKVLVSVERIERELKCLEANTKERGCAMYVGANILQIVDAIRDQLQASDRGEG